MAPTVPTDNFGVYLHVPFCATRCGYCDFNTYTAGELGSDASAGSYLDAIVRELELALPRVEAELGHIPTADTVFIGGGTPSLLGVSGLNTLLSGVRNTFGLSVGAEVTTESNPESTSPEFFEGLLQAGFTRVSLGMQSLAPHVLAVLDRSHTPGRAPEAAREAIAAGFEHVNLDMIYGTPGETDDDVRTTVAAAIDAGVDHVSAYSLIVEEGTAMGRKVRRGELPEPDEDALADRYAIIDNALREAGMGWYEVSNWAEPGGQCRHNMLYWRDGNWWGAGPGAHGHLEAHRLVNVKHPARYAREVSTGALPLSAVETLTDYDRHTEKIMLGLRLREGISMELIDDAAHQTVNKHLSAGLLQHDNGRIILTEAGRLLADGIITDILVGEELGEEELGFV
ncbi:radical SAM family heme chaperone HemW [Corynebacterium ulceribovis]|uniref:radical SAM family heme chaperone HemW n=1 Tax=Corynebacterium ulceribovis TaxID=487732 RepID=UPI00035D2A01|nr:radical SAM family heme chaperone HemW [Corynebacterium ulceribovis]